MWLHNGWICSIKTSKGVLQVGYKFQIFFWDIGCEEATNRHLSVFSALKRSKKRVRAVIQTEFPCLVSREFSSNQENEPYSSQSSIVGQFDKATADAHHARWNSLFNQMDRALSEEEKQLVSSLEWIINL